MTTNTPCSQLSDPTPAPNHAHAQPTEFERFYALDQLVRELFTFFGWFEGSVNREAGPDTTKTMKGVSIFAGTQPVEHEVTCTVPYSIIVGYFKCGEMWGIWQFHVRKLEVLCKCCLSWDYWLPYNGKFSLR